MIDYQGLSEDSPYPKTGILGAALIDFKRLVYGGTVKMWPTFWRTFAEQANADLLAIEFAKSELEIENAKLRKALQTYASKRPYDWGKVARAALGIKEEKKTK